MNAYLISYPKKSDYNREYYIESTSSNIYGYDYDYGSYSKVSKT